MTETRGHAGAADGDKQRRPLDRESIIEAARQIIEEQGLKRLTMRALGDRLGVKAMALYHYFASKDELLEAIGEMSASAAAQFGAFFDDLNASSATPQEIVVALGLRYIKFAEQHPDQFQLAFNTLPMRFKTWGEFVTTRSNFTIPQTAVQAGIDAGAFRERSGYGRDEMAFNLWALVHGLAVLRTTRLRDLDADFEQLHRTLLDALIHQFEVDSDT